MPTPAQVFFNDGLGVLFNQLGIGATPSATVPTYYVGLFTSLSGTTVPASTATLSNGGLVEVAGSNYSRQATTFGASAVASTSVATPTMTQSGTLATQSYLITLSSLSGIVQGMTITLEPGGANQESFVVTNVGTGTNGLTTSQITISSQTTKTHANGVSTRVGDAVNGRKSLGSQVSFLATGLWPEADGYFITTASTGTPSNALFYAANFADTSTPILNPNDTLKVTPTWLMSN
jgi:hypothetical protein